MGSVIIQHLQCVDHAMTVDEVAVLLAMDKSTVYRKVRSGSIPGFAFGSSVRIDPGELIEYLEKKTRLGARQRPQRVM